MVKKICFALALAVVSVLSMEASAQIEQKFYDDSQEAVIIKKKPSQRIAMWGADVDKTYYVDYWFLGPGELPDPSTRKTFRTKEDIGGGAYVLEEPIPPGKKFYAEVWKWDDNGKAGTGDDGIHTQQEQNQHGNLWELLGQLHW